MQNKNKLTVEFTQEEVNLILMGLEEIMSKEPHGSDKISLADHISASLCKGTQLAKPEKYMDSNGWGVWGR